MNAVRNLALLMFSSILCFACNPLPQHARLIPQDSFGVLSVNLKAFLEKGNLEDLKNTRFYDRLLREMRYNEEAQDFFETYIEDPHDTGLDLTQNGYIYVVRKGEAIFVGTTMAIKDIGQFERMLSDVEELEIDRQSNYSVVTVDREFTLAWNDDRVVTLTGTNYEARDERRREALVEEVMTDQGGPGLGEHSNFVDFGSTPHDIALWLNSSPFAQEAVALLRQMPSSGMTLNQEDLEDNFVHAFLNFESGKITLETRNFLNSKLPASLRIRTGSPVAGELLEFLPGEDLIGAVAASINLDDLWDNLKDNREVQRAMDEMEEETGVSPNDVVTSLSGQAAFSLAGITEVVMHYMDYDRSAYDTLVSEYNSYTGNYEMREVTRYRSTRERATRTEKLPRMMLTVGMNNRRLFDKVLDKIQAEIVRYEDDPGDSDRIESEGDIHTYIPRYGPEVYFGLSDDLFFITNSIELKEGVKHGGLAGNEGLDSEAKGVLSERSLGAYVRINLSDYPEEMLEMLEREFGRRSFRDMKAAANLYEVFTLRGDNDGMRMELILKEKSKNSLAEIMDQIDMAAGM